MKRTLFFWKFITIIFFLKLGIARGQDAALAINSPKAIRLQEERAQTDKERAAVKERLLKSGIEASQTTQKLKTKDSSSFKDLSRPSYLLHLDRQIQYAKEDSLLKRSTLLRLLQADEVLRVAGANFVLDQMRAQMEKNRRNKAVELKKNYIESLKSVAQGKLLASSIDSVTFNKEIAAIAEIDKYLGMRGYLSGLVDSPKALML
jgi:hypothetical protein